MSTITTRAGKGSELSYTEGDNNLKIQAVAKTANYTLLIGDNRDVVEFNGSSLTATLPVAATIAAAANTTDYQVTIKNNHSTNLTIARSSTDTIDGATSYTMYQYDSATFKVNQAQTGYNVVSMNKFNGVTSTAAELNTLDGVTTANVKVYGATGDGTTNDYTSISSAYTAATDGVFFPAGTYVIGTNFTISKYTTLDKGAILKPSSGVTITVSSKLNATQSKCFDVSAGGSVVLGTTLGQTIVYPEWWGALSSDSTGTTNKAAIQACFNYATDAHTVVFNDQFIVDDYLRFNSGTKFVSNLADQLGGVRFKVTKNANVALMQSTSTANRCIFDGVRFQIDSTSTFGVATEVKLLYIFGGRFVKIKNCAIEAGTSYASTKMIGISFAANTTSNPVFNEKIIDNYINGFDVDIELSGDSSNANLLCVGYKIARNECLGQTTKVAGANIRLSNSTGIEITNNTLNNLGETGGANGKNILIENACVDIGIMHNYYEGGINGYQKIQIAGTSQKIQILEHMISSNEVSNTSGNAHTLMDGANQLLTKTIAVGNGGSSVPLVVSNNGAPEGVVAAIAGSICLNESPVATEYAVYIKRTGAAGSNTGWEGVGTVL